MSGERVYEAMRRFPTQYGVVRVWLKSYSAWAAAHDEYSDFSAMVRSLNWEYPSGAAETVANWSGVNAVEFVDQAGKGLVIYNDWP